jgi:hypothetical protein
MRIVASAESDIDIPLFPPGGGDILEPQRVVRLLRLSFRNLLWQSGLAEFAKTGQIARVLAQRSFWPVESAASQPGWPRGGSVFAVNISCDLRGDGC